MSDTTMDKTESDEAEAQRASKDLEKNPTYDDAVKNSADANGVTNDGEPSVSAYSVYWEEPVDQDPENPLNWPSRRKWGIIGVLSFLSFLTYVFYPP
jgi:hypothetical protein